MITYEQLLNYANNHKLGFTIDLQGNEPKTGFCVSITKGMTLRDAYDAACLISSPAGRTVYIGGWWDGTSFIVDLTYVVPEQSQDLAADMGRFFVQDAVWQLQDGGKLIEL